MMDIRSNGDWKKAEHQSLIERTSLEVKQVIFKIIYSLLKDENQSQFLTSLFILIQGTQLLFIPFNDNIWETWENQKFTQYINKIFGFFILRFDQDSFSNAILIMYILQGIVAFILMFGLLVSYNNRVTSSWLVQFVRILITLLITILYMPTMDSLFSVVNCVQSNGVQILQQFPDIVCWSNQHVVHGVVAICCIIFTFILSTALALLYYEPCFILDNPQSRKSAQPFVFILYYKFIMVLCYTFMEKETHDYLMLIIMTAGSFIIFNANHIQQPYYNYWTQKLWSIVTSINLWTVLFLWLAKTIENILFDGLVYACFAGYPIIIITVIYTEKYDQSLLLMNLYTQQNSSQLINLNNYLLRLMNQTKDKSLLDAFIEIHKATCRREDCSLKQKKYYQQNAQHEEKQQLILLVIAQLYFDFIKKFPNDIDLRFKYCLFLYDQLKQRQQAINELNQCSQLHPSFDLEFQINRYKAIIDKEVQDQQTENVGNLDFISELAHQQNIKLFQNKIERATLTYMDFWSQLQEDNPDVAKMNDIGAKINQQVQSIEMMWNKLQRKSGQMPKIMRIYGKFVIDVLQDNEFGEQIMMKARQMQLQNNKLKNLQAIQLVIPDDIQFEQLPSLIISTAEDKFGIIQYVNLSCCNMFGYQKGELLNRKINMLMPTLYSKFHDHYIQEYIRKADPRYVAKERFIYYRHKNNYINICAINLKLLPQIDDNILIAAQFKLIKTMKASAYILIDYDDVVESISSSCIPMLNIDTKQIYQKKMYIHDVIKNFPPHEKRQPYLNKGGENIFINLLDVGSQVNLMQTECLTELENYVYNCQIYNIFNETNDQVMGQVIKLEACFKDNTTGELKVQQKAFQNSFQFKYIPGKGQYMGEQSLADLNSVINDQSIFWEQAEMSSQASQMPDPLKSESEQLQQTQKSANYGDGIKTLRLYENRIHDIDEKLDDISDDEVASQNISVFQNQIDQEGSQVQLGNQNNVFRSRQNLMSVIRGESTPLILRSFSYIINTMFIFIIVLSFLDYFLIQSQYQQVKSVLNLIYVDNLRHSALSMIVSAVQNLVMFNIGIKSFDNTTQSLQKQYINIALDQLTTNLQIIMFQDYFLNAKLNEMYTKSVIKIRTANNTFQYYDLFQASQQVVSKTRNVNNLDIQNITLNNSDVYFLLYNLQNDMLSYSRNSCNLYVDSLLQTSNEKVEYFSVLLGIAIGLLVLGLLIILIIFLQIYARQEIILQTFLAIPERAIKYLYNKSESFISNLQVGEDDDVLSEIGDIENDNQNSTLNKSLKSKNKLRKYKNSSKQERNYILSMLLIVSIIIAYFLFNYFMSGQLLGNINQQAQELNATARALGFFRTVDNCERSVFLNRNMTLINRDSYTQLLEFIDYMYVLDSIIHQEHALNSAIQNPTYNLYFNKMFMYEPCTELSNYQFDLDYDSCESFADGAIFQGLAVGLSRYFENIRYLMTIYDQIWGNPGVNFTTITRGFTTFKNITKNSDNVTNYIYNLNNYNQSKEALTLQMTYIKGAFELLMQHFIAGIELDISGQLTQRLALFIVFQILLFTVYFILYMPLYMKITKDFQATRELIIMIPLQVILKIKLIRGTIRDIIKSKDIQI